MAKEKPGTIQVKSFGDHHVITQPNPLRKVLLRVPESDLDDPVARAEKALAGLSGEFKNWMTIEADRLPTAASAVLRDGFTAAVFCAPPMTPGPTPPRPDSLPRPPPPKACAASSNTRPTSIRSRRS